MFSKNHKTKATAAFFIASGLFSFSAIAEEVSYTEIKTLPLHQEFKTTKNWQLTAYQPSGDDSEPGDISAKLCFWESPDKKEKNCTDITSSSGKTQYHYQTVKELSITPVPHLVKLVAEFSGGGSGALTQLLFWRYDKNTDSFEKAGSVTLTEQGEYKLIDNKMLITADAHWREGETHFSPHQFTITGYNYARSAGYEKSFSYLTANTYPSFDDTNKIDVIDHEMPEIKKRQEGK